MRSAAFVLAASLLSLRAFAAQVDGPYVVRTAEGRLESWTIESGDEGPHKRAQPVAVGAKLEVAGVGNVPAFEVTLRAPAPPAADAISPAASAPLFFVADTHGEYEIFVEMLRAHQVVDAKLQWSFGRGQLVILGDVLDRGAHQTEIL